MYMALRFLDMFAGIGGFRSGLEKIGGFECIGHCEIDKHANKAYNAIYNTEGEAFYEDATKIAPDELPDIELICAGFPCQSFSVAGKRLGFEDDTRGTLFFEIARIAKRKRVPYLLLENVPGLLSHNQGKTFETILFSLEELGYHVEWFVLNSANFGVPQERKRLFIVGSLSGECIGEISPIHCRNAKTVRQIVGGSQGQRVYDPSGVACTQCASAGGWGGKTGLYFIDMNENPVITEHARCITARQDSGVSNRKGEHSGVMMEINRALSRQPRAVVTPDKPNPRQQGRHIKNPNENMFTITAQDRHGVWHEGIIRKLMPLECWRLQGFTDEQFYKAEATGLKDSHLYKMAGNAVTVPVISAIGQKLKYLIYKNQKPKRSRLWYKKVGLCLKSRQKSRWKMDIIMHRYIYRQRKMNLKMQGKEQD